MGEFVSKSLTDILGSIDLPAKVTYADRMAKMIVDSVIEDYHTRINADEAMNRVFRRLRKIQKRTNPKTAEEISTKVQLSLSKYITQGR
jgi:hypothetical protein